MGRRTGDKKPYSNYKKYFNKTYEKPVDIQPGVTSFLDNEIGDIHFTPLKGL